MVTHMLFVMEFPQISHGATYQQKRLSEISNFNQIGLLQHVDMSLNTELKRKEQEIENEGRDEYKRIKKINMLCTIYT
jgi:hypothetical protein